MYLGYKVSQPGGWPGDEGNWLLTKSCGLKTSNVDYLSYFTSSCSTSLLVDP